MTDGAGHTVVTNSVGVYTFAHLPAGAYLITPARFGYTFAPVDQNVSLVDADAGGINFTATQLKYSISGKVINYLGEPMAGVTISDDLGHTVLTNATGDYTLDGYPYGYYVVTPSRIGYYFTPAYEAVTVLDNHRTGIDFVGTPDGTLFRISGVIKDADEVPIPEVSVTDGLGQTVKTNENGEYTLIDLPAGEYTITPEKAGYMCDRFRNWLQSVLLMSAVSTSWQRKSIRFPAPFWMKRMLLLREWMSRIIWGKSCRRMRRVSIL